MEAVEFIEKNFEIHGEFNGEVYRRKRNGELEVYPYDPVSYYQRSALVIRNEWIRRFAAQVSNPHEAEYKSVLKKLLYYTPYILNTGKQKFTAETVFYVRERGEYEFFWNESDCGCCYTLCKRTKVSLSFPAVCNKILDVYFNDEIYCRRWFMITDAVDLDAEYEEWLACHAAEILLLPEPEYPSLKTYRRGMYSKAAWINALTGRYHEEVFMTRKDLRYKDTEHKNPWIYHRKCYDHSENPQTLYFDSLMDEIGAEWNLLSDSERKSWNDKAEKYVRKRITGFNLFVAEYLRGS